MLDKVWEHWNALGRFAGSRNATVNKSVVYPERIPNIVSTSTIEHTLRQDYNLVKLVEVTARVESESIRLEAKL